MNKRGFTLMELMVYMAIVGIVVVIAGQVYSDSTKMRVRTQSMISANQMAEDIASLFKDDVGQMGAKSSQESRTISSDSFYVASEVYMNASGGDYSSFNYKRNAGSTRSDSLTFRYVRYDDDGLYSSVQEVSWFLKGDTLWRSCKTIAKKNNADENCATDEGTLVYLADGITSFEVTPAKPGVLDGEDDYLFPSSSDKKSFRFVSRYDGTKYFRVNTSPAEGGTSISVSGFVSNFDNDVEEITTEKKVNEFFAAEKNGSSDDWNKLCSRMSFLPGVNYEMSFKMMRLTDKDRSQMFVVGKDHMTIGFRKLDGSAASIPDFAFYPPMADEANDVSRNISFSVSSPVDSVCLAIDVAAYSPLLSAGTLNFSSLIVKKSIDSKYNFVADYEPVLSDKVNVKAFLLNITIRKNNEYGNVSLVVPVPSNGVGNH